MPTRAFIPLLLCLCLAGVRPAYAQFGALSAQAARQPTVDSINAQLASLEGREGLSADEIAAAKESLQRALEELTRASKSAEQTAKDRALAAQAPQLLQAIRDELARPPTVPVIPPPEERSLSQLEQGLSQATADLQNARQAVSDLQVEATRRDERRTAIPQQIATLREQLSKATDLGGAEDEAEPIREARRTLFAARQIARAREIEALEAEFASYDARRDLLPARRDQAQRRVSDAERLVQALQGAVSRQRQADAEQAAREAQRQRRDAAAQHPALRKFAQETADRAATRVASGGTPELIDTVSRRATDLRALAADLRTRYDSIRQRVDASGLSRATGLQLRRLYEGLPDELELSRSVRTHSRALDNAEYDLIELQDERLAAGDIDRAAQQLVSLVSSSPDAPPREEVEPSARELASARRDLLDVLIADQLRYRDQLAALLKAEEELLEATRTQRVYIEENILWVRSIDREQRPSVGDLRIAVEWLFSPARWSQVLSNTVPYVSEHRVRVSFFAALLLALWALGFRMRVVIRRIAARVSRYSTDRFAYTVVVVALTLLLAAPIPLAFYAAGWLLERGQDQVPLGLAYGYAFRTVGVTLYPLLVLRHSLRSQGLAEAHFRWAPASFRSIRRQLRWFLPVVVPVAVLVLALDREAPENANATLGRILFSVGLVALAIFLHRILRPTGPVLGRFLENNMSGAFYKLRRVWHPLIVLTPLLFAALSWFGYYYTAMRLEARFEESLTLVFALVFADAVLFRWLFIARRRVAVEDARRRREQAAAERGASDTSQALPAAMVDDEKVNLPALSGQTRQLFRAAITVAVVIGFYVIWAEALPALRMLDRVQLWPSVEVIDGPPPPTASNPTADGAVHAGSGTQNGAPVATTGAPGLPGPSSNSDTSGAPQDAEEPASVVTLADAGFAIVILGATWLAFRNIPGLIEIILLQRLPLDAGARYALGTVLRYLIVIVGIVVALNSVSITWGKVQWLAAALTFGLAFGLQEVFANFVSGLIILAERPIRIGDTVTVGGVSGTVTRIRMRATTIADWDRKELIIPNKTFITSDVINWTLSDSVLRVTLPVGVSYGSDVTLVERTLLRLADESEMVLDDPRPVVLFKTFGDSTLDFELRVFIASIESFVPIRHELNNAIIREFRAAKIEIAFPQRDLHLRSVENIEQILSKGAPPPASAT